MRRYQTIDLTLLALIVCGLEAAAHAALGFFPTEAFAFSVVLPVCLIVMMRWGAWGLLHAALGGLVYSLINGGGFEAALVYGLGSLAVAGNLLWFRLASKRRVRDSAGLSAAFAATGYLFMATGRALMAALVTGTAFFGCWVRLMSIEALSGAMAVVVLLVARRRDKNGSVFEDQREYLARLAAGEDTTCA
ncbi:MAG TPA: hypothetical protein VN540_01525 [Clostridia bacterium]|nr:hypothetical protein [Clostridia bacterium]